MKKDREFCRIKRGMVFSYAIDKNQNKYQSTISINGSVYSDHIQHGVRDWVVISNDDNNMCSPTCNIIPITSQTNKTVLPTHVEFEYQGKKLTVLCEQIRTINAIELQTYRYFINNNLMDKIEDALAIQLGMSKVYGVSNTSLEKIEEIIDNIVKSKVIAYTKSVSTTMDIDDTVLKIASNLEDLFKDELSISKNTTNVNNSINTGFDSNIHSSNTLNTSKNSNDANTSISQIDKFNKKWGNKSKITTGTNTKKTRVQWTKENMDQFMIDVGAMSPIDVAKKWNMKDAKAVMYTKYYIIEKLNKLAKERKLNG